MPGIPETRHTQLYWIFTISISQIRFRCSGRNVEVLDD